MSDATIKQDVMNELEFEPSVCAEHIGVAVDNGIVTLSGHVSTYAEKFAAERAATRVSGVRGIAEEIEVRFTSDPKTADDEIAERVLNVLKWSTVVPKGIMVKVQKGWVTLTGQVEWHFQQSAAENSVRHLIGVAGVINNVTIKPQLRAIDVKRKIEEALRRNAEVEANGVRVTAVGDRVTLEGTVHDWQERRSVELAAWSVPGVGVVTDHLSIAGQI